MITGAESTKSSNDQAQKHRLFILSNDYRIYQKLIEEANLPELSILADDQVEKALESGRDCDILFGEPSRVAKVINHMPNILWVQSTWAGVEPLFASEIRRDYELTNARNVYGGLISEYVFGYLLMIERQSIARWKSQLEGKWDARPHGTLKGKRIGLLGVGTIGARLAKTAQHFEMKVYGYSRESETCPDVDRYFHAGEFVEFAQQLDYLVCSLPGTPATKHLINAELLSALPSHAWVVNVGRGSVMEEAALVEALTKGKIAGAVLDVFTQEPLPKEHPLWKTPNTFITFHTAAINYPPDIAALFIENYRLFIGGKALKYRVDFDQRY